MTKGDTYRGKKKKYLLTSIKRQKIQTRRINEKSIILITYHVVSGGKEKTE